MHSSTHILGGARADLMIFVPGEEVQTNDTSSMSLMCLHVSIKCMVLVGERKLFQLKLTFAGLLPRDEGAEFQICAVSFHSYSIFIFYSDGGIIRRVSLHEDIGPVSFQGVDGKCREVPKKLVNTVVAATRCTSLPMQNDDKWKAFLYFAQNGVDGTGKHLAWQWSELGVGYYLGP